MIPSDVGLLQLRVESRFDRRFVRAIWAYLGEREASRTAFAIEESAIYRVPLPLSPVIELATEESGPAHKLERSPLELLLLGHRIYLLDGKPGALFGKPSAVFVFSGIAQRPVLFLPTEGPVFLNGMMIPVFDREIRARWQVAGPPIDTRGFATTPEQPGRVQGCLVGPFPPTDLPNPAPGGTPPPLPAPPPAPGGSSVNLFYGICFQNPLSYTPIVIGGFATGQPDPGDPLWGETQQVTAAFGARGYTTKTGLAGGHDPANASTAGSYAEMMSGLATDIGSQLAFCNAPTDQLVIFVAAHGYRRSAVLPTGLVRRVAMKYQSRKGSEEWIPHARFLSDLAAIPKIAASPAKVFLIVYSCRSGRIFEGGVIPGQLAGMHIITGAADSGTILGAGQLSDWIWDALRRGSPTWNHFIQWLKWRAGSGAKFPRNGDAAGCRARVTLKQVTYGGGDIGQQWEYDIEIEDQMTSIAEHVLANGASETPGTLVHDSLWGPCPSPVTMDPFTVRATEKDGLDNDVGSLGAPASFTCDGALHQHPVVVPVSEGGVVAQLKFDFEIATTC